MTFSMNDALYTLRRISSQRLMLNLIQHHALVRERFVQSEAYQGQVRKEKIISYCTSTGIDSEDNSADIGAITADVVDFVKFANVFKMSVVNTIKEVSTSKLPLFNRLDSEFIRFDCSRQCFLLIS